MKNFEAQYSRVEKLGELVKKTSREVHTLFTSYLAEEDLGKSSKLLQAWDRKTDKLLDLERDYLVAVRCLYR